MKKSLEIFCGKKSFLEGHSNLDLFYFKIDLLLIFGIYFSINRDCFIHRKIEREIEGIRVCQHKGKGCCFSLVV